MLIGSVLFQSRVPRFESGILIKLTEKDGEQGTAPVKTDLPATRPEKGLACRPPTLDGAPETRESQSPARISHGAGVWRCRGMGISDRGKWGENGFGDIGNERAWTVASTDSRNFAGEHTVDLSGCEWKSADQGKGTSGSNDSPIWA
jgi:hypothetical protein